ncbi:transposase [Planctopirus limnophila]|uniref:transposase n=1 Tax=Planctopirus limnophila TaxID=120 RepID=UPI0001A2FC6A|nr:transposase [Planctopirus limnophila]
MLKRHALSDELWKRFEPLCSGKAGDPGRTAADNRLFVEGVIFVLKTGISWTDLPE